MSHQAIDERSRSALVLLSGGQDSTTCLYWALSRFERVEAVTFDYGQRHIVEVSQAKRIAHRAEVAWSAVSLSGLLMDSALLGQGSGFHQPYHRDPGLPSSFVPGRNTLFFSVASIMAYTKEIGSLIGGMSAVDGPNYPDCRKATIRALEAALSLSLNRHLRIFTPLIALSKAEIWRLSAELGIVDVIIEDTHTGYDGDRRVMNAWGRGNEADPANALRAEGFREACVHGWLDGHSAPPANEGVSS